MAWKSSLLLALVGSLAAMGCSSVNPLGVDGGTDGTCASLGNPCGSYLDAEGNLVDCGVCRFERGFESDALVTAGRPALAATSDGLVLAYVSEGSPGWLLRVVSLTASGNTVVDAVPNVDDLRSAQAPGLAVSPSGAVHLATVIGDSATVVSAEGGLSGGFGAPVKVQEITGLALAPTLALASDGALHLGYLVRRLSEQDVWHAVRRGGTWTNTLVETYTGTGAGIRLGMTLDSAGNPHFLYQDGAAQMRHATSSGGAFSVTVVDTLALRVSEGLGAASLALDPQGRIHALWPRGPFDLMYGVRSAAGVWTSELLAGGHSDRDNALVIDATGTPRIAHFNSAAARFVTRVNGVTVSQGLDGRCDEGGLALALDGSGKLHAAVGCSSIRILTLSGKFPEGYARDCADIVSRICAKSAGCGTSTSGGPDSCVLNPPSHSICFSSFGCTSNMNAVFCSDVTVEPDLVGTCLAAVDTGVCTTVEGDPAYEIPGACVPLWQE